MIKDAIVQFKKDIPDDVQLVAVSKTKPSSAILEAYDSGHRIFGENRAQELADKAEKLADDIHWHMVGHIQTKKVKYIAPYVTMIHSIDKLKTLREVNKRAEQNERVIQVLLQFHIAQEESKFGLNVQDAENMLFSDELKEMQNIIIKGVMGMASQTDQQDQIRKEFQELRKNFESLKEKFFNNNEDFNVVSMGMSNDYKIAIEEGSNMIRIGSDIFGARE